VAAQRTKATFRARAMLTERVRICDIDCSPIWALSIFNKIDSVYCQSIISKNNMGLVVYREMADFLRPLEKSANQGMV
jgi:hypothetical protein